MISFSNPSFDGKKTIIIICLIHVIIPNPPTNINEKKTNISEKSVDNVGSAGV